MRVKHFHQFHLQAQARKKATDISCLLCLNHCEQTQLCESAVLKYATQVNVILLRSSGTFYLKFGVAAAQWVELRTSDQKVAGSNARDYTLKYP